MTVKNEKAAGMCPAAFFLSIFGIMFVFLYWVCYNNPIRGHNEQIGSKNGFYACS
jgi:hypothetical protein